MNHIIQLHVVLFVHRAVLPLIRDVEAASVPTGIRIKPTSIRLGNKGGVGIRFKFGDTIFAFVTCHLSAHQHRVQRRNEDFRDIDRAMNQKLFSNQVKKKNWMLRALALMKGVARVNTSTSLTSNTSVDHQIWLGDFNYRIDHNNPEFVIKTIENGKHRSLLERDQMLRERKKDKEHAFGGLSESSFEFKPTYKFDPNTDKYARKKRRIPSWTDRVLYKVGTKTRTTKPIRYDSLDHIRTSDHRPVVATFKCDVSLTGN